MLDWNKRNDAVMFRPIAIKSGRETGSANVRVRVPLSSA
jgi:hypothetical protein